MVENIGKIPPPYPEEPEYGGKTLGIDFYANDILKNFLISRKLPNSSSEQNEIEKISKNLSTLIWIGESGMIDRKNTDRVIEDLKDLKDSLHFEELYKKTTYILQTLKNTNEKIKIIEHMIDIAYEINKNPQNQEEFQKLFDAIIEKAKNRPDFFTIQADRELKDIKERYLNGQMSASHLLENLERISKLS